MAEPITSVGVTAGIAIGAVAMLKAVEWIVPALRGVGKSNNRCNNGSQRCDYHTTMSERVTTNEVRLEHIGETVSNGFDRMDTRLDRMADAIDKIGRD